MPTQDQAPTTSWLVVGADAIWWRSSPTAQGDLLEEAMAQAKLIEEPFIALVGGAGLRRIAGTITRRQAGRPWYRDRLTARLTDIHGRGPEDLVRLIAERAGQAYDDGETVLVLSEPGLEAALSHVHHRPRVVWVRVDSDMVGYVLRPRWGDPIWKPWGTDVVRRREHEHPTLWSAKPRDERLNVGVAVLMTLAVEYYRLAVLPHQLVSGAHPGQVLASLPGDPTFDIVEVGPDARLIKSRRTVIHLVDGNSRWEIAYVPDPARREAQMTRLS